MSILTISSLENFIVIHRLSSYFFKFIFILSVLAFVKERMSGASGSRKPNMDEIMQKWETLKCEWYNNKLMSNLMLLWDQIKS